MDNTTFHFPVQLDLRIDWSEQDVFGHVNNVAFYKYVQASRVRYWETIGILPRPADGTGPMLASCSCRFIRPLFYPGTLRTVARMEFIKNTSFGLHHLILNSEGETAAEAHDVIVMFDFHHNRKIRFPEELRRKVEALEGASFG